MADKTFTITCTMKERWINQFMSFLDYMEHNGKIGHSCRVGFFADGDGDFRPTFDIDREYKKTEGHWKELEKQLPVPEVIFDAG